MFSSQTFPLVVLTLQTFSFQPLVFERIGKQRPRRMLRFGGVMSSIKGMTFASDSISFLVLMPLAFGSLVIEALLFKSHLFQVMQSQPFGFRMLAMNLLANFLLASQSVAFDLGCGRQFWRARSEMVCV